MEALQEILKQIPVALGQFLMNYGIIEPNKCLINTVVFSHT